MEKTHIAYGKDYMRKEKHEKVQFEFLGFSDQPRARKSRKTGKLFTAFTAEINQSNMKRIREIIRGMVVRRNTRTELSDLAKRLNPKLRGWIDDYGLYSINSLSNTLLMVDTRLIVWLSSKYKMSRGQAIKKLHTIKRANPRLFYHWEKGYCFD
jgi:hypothetical protein